MKVPNLVLVGPTNVGKSTLFNRLTRTRAAIVCDRPGVTVDKHELELESSPVGPIRVVDTGGVGLSLEKHPLGKEIEFAATKAVDEADILLFVVDGTREPGADEFEVASWLRKQKAFDGKPCFVVVNKSDVRKGFHAESYYSLGLGELLSVSAEHDEGISALWDRLGEELKIPPEQRGQTLIKKNHSDRIIVLGRPNVGKSTLLNALLGEEKHVVSPVAGTTRDTIASEFFYKGQEWALVDTAGLRRPGKLERGVEWVAKEKLKDEARKADLAILVVDAAEGITDQDTAIASMALEFGLSIIVVLNKWDLMRGEKMEDKLFHLERTQDLKMAGLDWVPMLRVSALEGRGLGDLLKKVSETLETRRKRVSTAELNRIFEKKFKYHSHPLGPGGKTAKFYYMAQVDIRPPRFVMFTNISPKGIHVSYRRYVMNALRKEFNLTACPIELHFKLSAKTDYT